MKKLLLIALFAVSCASTSSPPPPHPAVGAAFIGQVSETVSLAATVRSSAVTTVRYDTLGIAVRTTGTATGTWTIQYSNDFILGVDDPTLDTKWDTYTLSSTIPAAAGSAQTFGVILDNYEFAWERVKFTSTGGTGSALIVTQLKGN